ncbi:prepilin-type N-terminal cleavage/methylation domain-containing protein [Clostridium estertheticum]|uniref:PilW family protein n=1 Tax=Clostridium estertheticum TaxID=238834 RepID=UPI001CF3053E|nr:prepilin-type N-terminal cleavage/methylation domain-containing protein [Clostridium estertheticum]MCB2307954.1 prepilin-type N-terminal cleavage/methylation domain-containing protein [Clostridium estertheticum]MCB2346078.1 prepilin-type N-terminal cleavage/methylation domain-containing protein [Clostridium estertheticum]MCB2351336.1 prepilin-type N-terminal cleavage/methylation domain-containing protein [Clostridium estertheticum]WAG44221.1 prepilin-type N-terminal cleavage/methylation doma
MKKNKCFHKGGFTLVELIVTIAIMLMVITMVFSIGNFGNRYFKKTNIQIYNQEAVRLVGDYIKQDIRFAKVINSDKTIVKKQNEKSNYYALLYKGGHLVKQVIKNSDDTLVSEKTIGDLLTDLSFISVTDKGMLKYKVTNNANGQNYSVTYEVILDNISVVVLPSNSTTTIYYSNN